MNRRLLLLVGIIALVVVMLGIEYFLAPVLNFCNRSDASRFKERFPCAIGLVNSNSRNIGYIAKISMKDVTLRRVEVELRMCYMPSSTEVVVKGTEPSSDGRIGRKKAMALRGVEKENVLNNGLRSGDVKRFLGLARLPDHLEKQRLIEFAAEQHVKGFLKGIEIQKVTATWSGRTEGVSPKEVFEVKIVYEQDMIPRELTLEYALTDKGVIISPPLERLEKE